MLDKRNQTLQSLPVANYCPAIARAVEWQGDRYLLGKPVNAAPSRESHYHYPHLTDHHT
jgi:hypothetical protein